MARASGLRVDSDFVVLRLMYRIKNAAPAPEAFLWSTAPRLTEEIMFSKNNCLASLMLGLVCCSTSANASANNWMSTTSSSSLLSQLSIPGTHDSCALYDFLGISGTAKCQTLSIASQLSIGVRFLDIRMDNVGTYFEAHHGVVDEQINFTQVLSQVSSFLSANPTETVVMSLKEENSSTGSAFDTLFQSTYVAANPGLWYLGTSIPTLGAVRGKIVLLRRFSSSSAEGIDATNWADNTSFTPSQLDVEDYYNDSSAAAKWSAVQGHLNDASSTSDSSHLYLTFTSGYVSGIFGIPNILTVSNYVNPQLTSYFGGVGNGRYGVVPMDYVTSSLASLVYGTNPVVNNPKL